MLNSKAASIKATFVKLSVKHTVLQIVYLFHLNRVLTKVRKISGKTGFLRSWKVREFCIKSGKC